MAKLVDATHLRVGARDGATLRIGSSPITGVKRNGSTPQRKQGLITLVSKLKWMAERVRKGSGADNPQEEYPSVG